MRSRTENRGLRPAACSPQLLNRTRISGPRTADHGLRSIYRAVGFAMVVVSTLALGACRQDMHNTPTGQPLRESLFTKNVSTSRAPVEGTVARGTLQDDAAFFTGKVGTATVKELPFPVDDAVLNRGQDRFNIYCTPCHDATGSGKGIVVQRGFKAPPSFHDERLRNADAGYFFDVMTNGFGAMPDYRMQLSARDRWAVVAYVRALQLSQHAAASDVPGGDPTKAQPAPPQPGAVKHD